MPIELFLNTHLADNLQHHGFHVIDRFLNQNDFESICQTIQSLHINGLCKPASIGKHHEKKQDATIRNDHIFWIEDHEENDAIDQYRQAMKRLSQTLNETLFLGLVDFEAHFAVYPPNHFYKKHVDQFTATHDRRISCVYYLNHNWQKDHGGALVLYDKKGQPLTEILPQGNRFVCFTSDLPHEVCTAYQTRYSIAAWLKVRPMDFRGA